MIPQENKKVIKGAFIVNEGQTFKGDVFLNGQFIEKLVRDDANEDVSYEGYQIIDGEGQ